MGRESLLALDFVERREDLVLMGDVGTGKTHMASALCALACERRLEARFFTASSLVMRLRRARDDGRLDREAALIGKARLLVIDELGFLPLDADGARLLFQVFADAYERQSVVICVSSSRFFVNHHPILSGLSTKDLRISPRAAGPTLPSCFPA